jgi:pantoate--beta-alanine ligase
MSLRIAPSIGELRELLAEVRRDGKTIGLVPTMGALHAGHARLIEHARRECHYVTVSLFVNPTQFNQQEDYQRYPRDFARDQELCEGPGVDCIFAPSVEEMYPRPLRTSVDVAVVSEGLCGAFRPGHFRGVATVVAKLFDIVQPDYAYFGEKDAQQLAVIRRMVADLNLPVVIRPVPTVREPDGLALSSRNQLLNAEERRIAIVLYQALQAAANVIAGGESDAAAVKRQAQALFNRQPLVRLEYFEIVDPEEMQPVERITGPVRIAGAIWVGSTRLIDNVLATPPNA